MLAYQQSILALLQDDDEDIRLQVAQSVRVQLGSKTPVCQAVALKMWWIWCGTYMSTLQGAHREAWAGWIRDLAQDEAGYRTSAHYCGQLTRDTMLTRFRGRSGSSGAPSNDGQDRAVRAGEAESL